MSRSALVVDDSMLIRHTVCRYLEERGYRVESATNGAEALEILAKVQPDLIITDMMMPRMDGRQFISELKSRPETSQIPIVVLAAKKSADQVNETRANFVIFKDIDIDAQLTRALAGLKPA